MQLFKDLSQAGAKILEPGHYRWMVANESRISTESGKKWPGMACCSSTRYKICDDIFKLLSSTTPPSKLSDDERVGLVLLNIQAEQWHHDQLESITKRIISQSDGVRRLEPTARASAYRQTLRGKIERFKEEFIQPYENTQVSDIEQFYRTLSKGTTAALTKSQQVKLYYLAEAKEDRSTCQTLLPHLKARFADLKLAIQEARQHRRDYPLTEYLIEVLAVGFRHLTKKQIQTLPRWVIEEVIEHPMLGATEKELCDKLLEIGEWLTPIFEIRSLMDRAPLHQMPYYEWREIRDEPLIKKWCPHWEWLDETIKSEQPFQRPRGVLSAYRDSANGVETWHLEVQNPKGFLDTHQSSYRHDPPTASLILPDDAFTFLLWRDEQAELRVAEGMKKAWNFEENTTFFHYNLEKGSNFGSGWGVWELEKGPWKAGRFVTHLSPPAYGKNAIFQNDFQKDWYWDHQEGKLPPTQIAFPKVIDEDYDFAKGYTQLFNLEDDISYETYCLYETDWYTGQFLGKPLSTRRWLLTDWIVHDQKRSIDLELQCGYKTLHNEAAQYQRFDLIEF